MKNPDQGSLFLQEPRTDTGEAAARIAAAAQPVEYPGQSSEAAIDQGWGPIDIPPLQTPRKLYELPGQNRGRSNSAPLPQPVQAQEGMTPEAIDQQLATSRTGAAGGRLALQQASAQAKK